MKPNLLGADLRRSNLLGADARAPLWTPVRVLPHRVTVGRKARQPPFTCDPLAHALQNQSAARAPLGTPPALDLVCAVARAVSDLEGQGARSDRIASQLQRALDRYFDTHA